MLVLSTIEFHIIFFYFDYARFNELEVTNESFSITLRPFIIWWFFFPFQYIYSICICAVVRCMRIDFQQVTAKVCDAFGPFLWNVKADGNTIFQVDIFWWPSFRFCSTEWEGESEEKNSWDTLECSRHGGPVLCPIVLGALALVLVHMLTLQFEHIIIVRTCSCMCAIFWYIVVGTFCASINSAAALGRMPEPDPIENRKMITIEINAWLIDSVLLMFASSRYAMCVRWKNIHYGNGTG